MKLARIITNLMTFINSRSTRNFWIVASRGQLIMATSMCMNSLKDQHDFVPLQVFRSKDFLWQLVDRWEPGVQTVSCLRHVILSSNHVEQWVTRAKLFYQYENSLIPLDLVLKAMQHHVLREEVIDAHHSLTIACVVQTYHEKACDATIQQAIAGILTKMGTLFLGIKARCTSFHTQPQAVGDAVLEKKAHG